MKTQAKPPAPFNWSFEWATGGYNSVIAATEPEARRKAEILGAGRLGQVRNLRPDADYAFTRENDRRFAGCCD